MKQLRVLALAPSFLFAAFLMSACTSTPRAPLPPSSGEPRAEPQPTLGDLEKPDREKPSREDVEEAQENGITPAHMVGREITRAAVLLPFSHPNRAVRNEAQGMLAGIEMALFEQAGENFLIIPKDTAGTVAGAETAFKEVVEEGADVLLGPLFAQNVRQITPLARDLNIPVIAFSNDPTAAGGGAFLAAFTVEEEVARVVQHAALNGVTTFAFLGPRNTYGERVERALRFEAARQGGYVVASQFYSPYNDAPVDEAQTLANILKPLTEDPRSQIGVMIPESGVKLRSVAPLLPYYGVDFRRLRMLGTSQWNDSSLWREPTLSRAWFPVPSSDEANTFSSAYRRIYGRAPSELSSLGFDAAGVAIGLSETERLDFSGITNPDGFLGANGLFRFRVDGTPERALAIMEIKAGIGAELVVPAATSFTPPIG
ncbi:MAG: penicillin-binding protein activator [Hyphomonadaceae bacterium]|nr:penicillin-binding protein activator [Hyphomonadaceae bacterium]